jgi:hypothetical protein
VPRIIRMPSEEELPKGTVRDFAWTLFWLYTRAHRPALRDISETIRKNDDLRGTASPETIRKMLRGTTVPANWATVDAVFTTLCDLAGRSSDWRVDWDGVKKPVYRQVEDTWHRALDYPDWYYESEPPRPEPPPEDPWADDDPPF